MPTEDSTTQAFLQFEEEIWKPIPDFTGIYEVSSVGRVKRVARAKGATVGAILKPYLLPNGYFTVVLSKRSDQKRFYIHLLVLKAFRGEVPNGKQGNHKDGKKGNNQWSNLEYVSPSQNIQHALRNGLLHPAKGEKSGRHKLATNQVLDIRSLEGRFTCQQTAKRFHISISQIDRIWKRTTWKHL